MIYLDSSTNNLLPKNSAVNTTEIISNPKIHSKNDATGLPSIFGENTTETESISIVLTIDLVLIL